MVKEEKRVHWEESNGQQDDHELLPQFKKSKKGLNFNKLKIQVFDIFRGVEYLSVFPSFINDVLPTNQLKEAFFDEQGHNILAFLLTYKEDLKALNLITQLFTLFSVQTAIKKEDFACLKKFLISQSSQELFSKDDELTRNLRIEKFKFLLELDYVVVKDYFKHPDQKYFTKKIQEDFIKATQEIDQNKNTLRM